MTTVRGGQPGRAPRPHSPQAVQGSAHGQRAVRTVSTLGSSLPGERSFDRGGSTARGQRGHAQGGAGFDPRSSEPLRSTTIANVNERHERALRNRSRGSRAPRILLVVVAVLLIAGVGLFALSRTSLFKIESVTVTGVSHLTSAELTQAAQVPAGATLLSLDAAGVEQRLEADPWVQDAVVERVFPNAVNLAITERAVTAVVDVQLEDSAEHETWALSRDGMWLMKVPEQGTPEAEGVAPQVFEDIEHALKISDVPYGSSPEAGTFCNNANVNNALETIAGLSTELADQVVAVAASNPESTTLTLDNGVEIAFGDATDIRDKERVALQLMQEHPGQIAYINVRTPAKPIWRSL